jgi:hypothetical protein
MDDEKQPVIIDTNSDVISEPEAKLTDSDVESCCRAIANGETTSSWCLSRKLDHGWFMQELRRSRAYASMLQDAKSDREEWLKESIIDMIQRMVSFDPRRAYDENGNYLPMNKMPDDIAYMIKKSQTVRVEQKDGPPDIVDRLEFWDKQKAIDQLGKHLKMFVDKVEIGQRVTLEESINKQRILSDNKK